MIDILFAQKVIMKWSNHIFLLSFLFPLLFPFFLEDHPLFFSLLDNVISYFLIFEFWSALNLFIWCLSVYKGSSDKLIDTKILILRIYKYHTCPNLHNLCDFLLKFVYTCIFCLFGVVVSFYLYLTLYVGL